MNGRWLASCALSALTCLATSSVAQAIEIGQGELTVLFRDNSRSPKVLSGLQSLFHLSAKGFDAFDPDTRGASAGLNFEHIISGHRNSANKFTPRHGKYILRSRDDQGSATLA